MEICFWILYLLGGIFFGLLTLKVNKGKNEAKNSMWVSSTSIYPLNLLVLGEIIWILCWSIGYMLYPNNLSLILGFFPILMPLITFGSLIIVKYKYVKRNFNREIKGEIKTKIKNWEKELPPEVKIKYINYELDKHRDVINGRVIIYMVNKKNFSSFNWTEYGKSLESFIMQPIIIQIKLNEELVYP